MASFSSSFDHGSGSLAANTESGTISVPGARFGRLVFQVTGTWVGTLTFSGSVDGTNFSTLAGTLGSTGGTASSTAANDLVIFSTAGLSQIRIAFTAFTSGTASVSWLFGLE